MKKLISERITEIDENVKTLNINIMFDMSAKYQTPYIIVECTPDNEHYMDEIDHLIQEIINDVGYTYTETTQQIDNKILIWFNDID